MSKILLIIKIRHTYFCRNKQKVVLFLQLHTRERQKTGEIEMFWITSSYKFTSGTTFKETL